MATTVFVNGVSLSDAGWFNDVNELTYAQAISVKNSAYGAVGDGSTNDTTAVQAALNASLYVFFPAGTYRVLGELTLREGHVLFGAGIINTIIKQDGTVTSSSGTFYANSGASGTKLDGIKIRDLTLDGQVASKTFSQFQHLCSLNGVKNAVLERVKFLGFRGDGLYIGSGITAGHERHNENVIVRDCIFDGVNNDNRNGISIIDCDGLSVTASDFQRCTKAGMPGSIDVEPDSSIFHVVRNIKITGNKFATTLGDTGHISLILSAADFTTKPQDFVITGNTFSDKVPLTVKPFATDNAASYNIVYSNNSGLAITKPIVVLTGYLRGLVMSGNTFVHTLGGGFGEVAGDVNESISIVGNVFVSSGTPTYSFAFQSPKKVVIADNVFAGTYSTADVGMGVAGGASSYITITGNSFPNTSVTAVNHQSTDVGDTNIFEGNNILAGKSHSFRAWRNDDCGTVTNDNTAVSFNLQTAPDSFPVGTSVAILNGNTTDYPAGTGGSQGTLRTFRLTNTAGFEKWTYQTLYHASNTLLLGSFWIRRRNQAANTWAAFFEQAP